MTVSAVSAAAPATAAAPSDAAKASEDYTNFLQLLVTELKNQDPMKPLDPTQTVTQLATFSSVQQAVKTNELISTLNANASLAQGAGLIGRDATSADGATSGQIVGVALSNTGLVATLDSGQTLALGDGVSIA